MDLRGSALFWGSVVDPVLNGEIPMHHSANFDSCHY